MLLGRSRAEILHKIELIEFFRLQRFQSDKRYVEKILHDEADEALNLTKGIYLPRLEG